MDLSCEQTMSSNAMNNYWYCKLTTDERGIGIGIGGFILTCLSMIFASEIYPKYTFSSITNKITPKT